MKTVIPLPGDKSVIGESSHGRWITGDKFAYDGKIYQFLGRDATSALHARCLAHGENNRLCVFESSHEWTTIPALSA